MYRCSLHLMHTATHGIVDPLAKLALHALITLEWPAGFHVCVYRQSLALRAMGTSRSALTILMAFYAYDIIRCA